MAYDQVFRNPNSGGVIICRMGGKRPEKCSYCFAPGTQLCDYKIAPGKTCDRPICKTHATPGLTPNTDYCREHAIGQTVPEPKKLPSLPALSVKPPWSWLITHAPEAVRKDYENRTWATKFKGPFLVHSSRQPVPNWREVCEGVKHEKGIIVPENAPCGVLLGIATMTECVDASRVNIDDPQYFWLQGPFGFKLKDSRPFSKPIPYRGALGFFTVPLEPVIIEQIKEHKEYHGIV